MKKLYNRVGEVRYNRRGSKMTIIEYINHSHVVVEFENGYKVKTNYPKFDKGATKNPYDLTVEGVGYIGEGAYNSRAYVFSIWTAMLYRCYSFKYLQKYPTYIGCTVCEDWHNFQNFAKWHKENFYQIENEIMNLDKDILVKGNKIYSPETCVFVPSLINYLFTKNDKNRGNLPIGVFFIKKSKHYRARCLGCYLTPEEAFQAYKQTKEINIKEIAEKYKEQIPEKLYLAMLNYKVEITD